ncbi:MAG: hypothetical protein U5J83_03180 [Bryobacterales bacterium]|nr:hypothetical protein [Bryobacterales bacterium]
MGKLSTEDYQQTKADLQKELSEVNADIDGVLAKLGASAASVPTGAKRKTAVKGAPVAAVVAGQSSTSTESTAAITCPHCHARFNRPMRFCGECGKPMEGAAQ